MRELNNAEVANVDGAGEGASNVFAGRVVAGAAIGFLVGGPVGAFAGAVSGGIHGAIVGHYLM